MELSSQRKAVWLIPPNLPLVQQVRNSQEPQMLHSPHGLAHSNFSNTALSALPGHMAGRQPTWPGSSVRLCCLLSKGRPSPHFWLHFSPPGKCPQEPSPRAPPSLQVSKPGAVHQAWAELHICLPTPLNLQRPPLLQTRQRAAHPQQFQQRILC